MGLFWVMTQQVLFCGFKYVYDYICKGEKTDVGRLLAANIAFFAFFAYVCFEEELGFSLIWGFLIMTPIYDLYQWGMCIFVCCSMIAFDLLVVLYIYRIVRVFRKGPGAARPTLLGDIVVVSAVALLGGTYYYDSVRASLALGFTMDEYFWVGRFFIQIANFCYAGLETAGAILFYLLLKKLKARKELPKDVA